MRNAPISEPSIRMLPALLLAALLAGSLARGQKNNQTDVMFQAALHKQLVDGDLEGAIQEYKTILGKYGSNRAVAAKAWVEMGQCYEKLGNVEARKAYERVLRDYADQNEAASEARSRLAILAGGSSAKSTEMVTRRVWSGSEWDQMGPPSPDGRFVPCIDWWSGPGDMAVCDLTSGKMRHLTNNPPDSLDNVHDVSYFSPDGKQLAYASSKGYSFPELRVVGLDGSKPRVVYSNESLKLILPLGWSPDSRDILAMLTSKQEHTSRMVWIGASDGSVREVKAFDTRYPLSTRLSPDGRFIAYDLAVDKGSENHNIYVVSSRGGRETPLVQHAANNYPLAWTPDGNGLLFVSDRSGSWDAWMVRVADGRPQGAPEIVKKDIGRVSPLGFARNGSFYYTVDASKSDLYTATLDLPAGEVLTPPSPVSQHFIGSNSDAAWSPDGRYLAYLSIRGPAWAGAAAITLRIRSLETGQEREVSPRLHNLGGSEWFPDGRSILVAGYDLDDHEGLYRIDVETGDVSPLARGEDGSYLYPGVFSPDGKTIFYCREDNRAGISILQSHDLATGRESELYRVTSGLVAIGDVALSPDGQQLAFLAIKRKESASLNVIPTSGGQPRQLVLYRYPEGITWNSIAWTRDGRELVFTKGRFTNSPVDQKTQLWAVRTEGGEPRKLDLAGEVMSGVRFHPDGKRIAFYSQTWGTEIWIMENFLPALRANK